MTAATGIVFPEPGRVELEPVEAARVGATDVAVRTRYSLLSTGTELTVLHRRWEPGSHWDQWVRFPSRPGYAAVGEVFETGAQVEDVAVGDRVALRKRHASQHVVPAMECTVVPQEVELSLAPWFALAKIAFMGARAARYGLGDTVLIVGAGPIGQMSVRWANAAGLRAVVVVDTVAARLELARRGGATAVVAKPISEASDEIRASVGAGGPDVVIDTTGNAEVLASALGVVKAHGRVVVLGDTGTPSRQHLTSDVIVRGVTVVGVHESHSMSDAVRDLLTRAYLGEEIVDVTGRAAALGWDADRGVHSLVFHLVRTGRFDLDGLNTHTFEPSDCAEAYALADERRGETMGILFDWSTR